MATSALQTALNEIDQYHEEWLAAQANNNAREMIEAEKGYKRALQRARELAHNLALGSTLAH